MLNFVASLPTVSLAFGSSVMDRFSRRELVWNKTPRYSKQVHA
jgi:hypothetical protein